MSGNGTNDTYQQACAIAQGLFPHQVEGVAFLLGRGKAILADDMGLGKTRQAVVAIQAGAPQGPYLVVCPASVKQNWAREITIVSPRARVQVISGKGDSAHLPQGGDSARPASDCWVVINYDLLAIHAAALHATAWAGLIFDEAHYLKNHTSQRSKQTRALVEAASGRGLADPAVYCLTGTPMTNRPRDLFPLLQLVGHSLGRSFLSFAKRYCAATQNQYGWVTDGASNLAELAVQLSGVMLRRNKEQVLDLPPKLRSWMPVEVPPETAGAEIREVVALLLGQQLGRSAEAGKSPGPQNRTRLTLLATLTKARLKLAKAKVVHTLDLVKSALDQNEKVIVFSGFDEPIKILKEKLGEAAVVLTGQTPVNKRQGLVDHFQQDPTVRVFLANIIAGGVGINLTAARQVIFNDLDWVPANHWQAEDRAYRIGQTGAVNVTYLVAEGTLDEFVKGVLEVKATLVAAVVEGQALGDGGTRDVLGELERLVGQLSPQLADTPAEELNEEAIYGLLRQAASAYAEEATAQLPPERACLVKGLPDGPAIPEQALRALARALSRPKASRYRVSSSSKPGKFYELQADLAGDVTCSCPGFEYRGMCSHARELKVALAGELPLPGGYSVVED